MQGIESWTRRHESRERNIGLAFDPRKHIRYNASKE
jgi:hypothetical protein